MSEEKKIQADSKAQKAKTASTLKKADNAKKAPQSQKQLKEKKPKAQDSNKESKKLAASQIPDIKPGMVIKVYEKIFDIDNKGKERERTQVFEGMVLARKHNKEKGATITVRKVSLGVAVEKIYPLYSPLIEKIEVVKQYRVRRAKLYYLREGYKKRLKEEKQSN